MSVTLLHPGVQTRILNESPAVAGTTSRELNLQSDAVLVSVFASSVTGTLDVSVYAITGDDQTGGEQALLFSFPQLSAATANLLLRRSAITLSRVRIVVQYSGACSYSINVRAVGSGSSDTRILGAANLVTTKATVGTSASLLIPSALEDRAGLLIKNWSTTQTVYVAETLVKATLSDGYPLAPRDAVAMDISAGVEIYAISDAPAADVRIVESGG